MKLNPRVAAGSLVAFLVAAGPCTAGPQGPRLVPLRLPGGELRAYIAPAHGADLAGLEVRHDGRWSELLYRGMDYRPTGGWTGKAPILWPAVGRTFPGPQVDSLGWTFHGRQYRWTIEVRVQTRATSAAASHDVGSDLSTIEAKSLQSMPEAP